MAVESSALNFNQPTPPVVKPLSEIAGVSSLGASLMGAADGGQARALIGVDQPTDPRPPSTHDHDGRYYTETEIDTLLAGKAAASHNHDTTYYTKAQVDAAVAAGGRRKVAALMAQGVSCVGQAVITNDDQILVWGAAANGTLSQAETATGIPMVLKINGTKTGTWAKVQATRYNVAALTSTGQLWVWGDNTRGQLGLGDTTNTAKRYRYGHQVVITGKTIADVTMAGSDTTFQSMYARCTDGTGFAWGYNAVGQLGINTTTDTGTPTQMLVPAGTSTSIVEISAANAPNAHVIVRTGDNRIHTCGYNAQGQLGLGDTTNRSQLVNVSGKSATAVQACGVFDATSTYYGLSQIITTAGALQSAGYNVNGAIGNASTTSSSTFVSTSLNHTNVSSLVKSAAVTHSAGYISSASILWLAGLGGSGQLGNGSTSSSNVFIQPSGAFQGFVTKAILAGIANGPAACIVLASTGASNTGEVYATGYNASGQQGDGSTTNATSFTKVPMPEAIVDIGCSTSEAGASGLATGATAFFALGASGRVYSWGANASGQCGQAHLNAVYVPCEVLIR